MDAIVIYSILQRAPAFARREYRDRDRLQQPGRNRDFSATSQQIHWPANTDRSRRYEGEEGRDRTLCHVL